MKRSGIVTALILILYLAISAIIFTAVADRFGVGSFAMLGTVVFIGPIFLALLMTHNGLDSFLKGLDKYYE